MQTQNFHEICEAISLSLPFPLGHVKGKEDYMWGKATIPWRDASEMLARAW